MSVEASMSIQKIFNLIQQQELDDAAQINLNANENQMSLTARMILSSRLSQRYNLGVPINNQNSDAVTIDDFTFKGLSYLNQLEQSTIATASKMFHAKNCEFRFLSGIHAMLASLSTFSNPGDAVYAMDYHNGGHFATQYLIQRFGRKCFSLPIDPARQTFDLCQLEMQFKKHQPKLIYFDMGCPRFALPIQDIRNIAGPEAIIIYDASHTLGLIAGGAFQDPLNEGADVLQGNTHKTFPGPPKALMAFRDQKHANMLSTALDHGLISNRHNHHDLALYITIMEMHEFGAEYVKQMLLNAQALAQALSDFGIELIESNGRATQTHILLIKGDSVGGYISACQKLMKANICTNSRYAFREEIIRLGTQEVTRRGMKQADMRIIADFIYKILHKHTQPEKLKSEVKAFNQKFNSIHFSFDNMVV